jgi:hypothetical protein
MIKNKGTKKLAKLPPDFERRAAGFVARRRFTGAAADLFFKVVVLRVRVTIIFSGRWSVVGSQKEF